MISHSKKFVLVHIPRTGGTVLEAGLGEYGIMLQGERNFESLYFKHASARAIQSMMGDVYDSYFKFSIVRNPWDWVVSNYEFNRGLHRCYVAGTAYEVASKVPDWAHDMPFDDWLRWWLEELNPSQLALLTDKEGTLLVDEVYRFENVRNDFSSICRRLGVTFRQPAGSNSRPRKSANFRDYYNSETRRRVADHFRGEIERFGYGFE